MSSKIREATEEDIFDILVLGREFSREAGEAFAWDKTKTENILQQAVHSDDVLILVLEDDGIVIGGLVGAVTTMPFASHVIATELAWFVDPRHRGHRKSIGLVKEYEKWAKRKGASYIVLAHIHKVADISNVYERLGYEITESSFMKKVS